jgi:hypothetical protein
MMKQKVKVKRLNTSITSQIDEDTTWTVKTEKRWSWIWDML